MDSSPIGRWALWGMSPAGRFLLERRHICDEFPLVVAGDAAAIPRGNSQIAWIDDWQTLLTDRSLTGIVLTVPLRERAARICEALRAGKMVLVDDRPCQDVTELSKLEAALSEGKGQVAVFSVQPADTDYRSAQAAYRTGRLGKLRRVVWVACDQVLESDRGLDAEGIETSAYELALQFLELTDELPNVVQAWGLPETAGIQLLLVCPSGLTASLEYHRLAMSGLRTGWVLEGTIGAYRQGRVTTRAADGELREESVVRPDDEEDVWIRLRRLAAQPETAAESWRLASRAVRLQDACRRSISSGEPVRCGDAGCW